MTSLRNVQVIVDGTQVDVPAGRSLLSVLRDLGVRVPTLCHDDRLTPYGGCRLCVVDRRDGNRGLIPACSTPVEEGMVVRTRTSGIVESRRRQLQLLLLNHRLDCPVCRRNGDCRLQDLIFEIGVPDDDLPFEAGTKPVDDRSPVIVRDPDKCIVCGRCVRLCEEVQGVAAIGFVNRGLELCVATFDGRPLDCEFCGQCVNACPVGALTTRTEDGEVPVWLRESVATTCGFCSCGCELTVESDEGRLQRVTSRPGSSPNNGKLCVKGWLGLDLLSDPDRLTEPLVRRDGRLVAVDWEEALTAAAAGIQEAAKSGRSAVGLGSGRLSCEDGYVLQRFMRCALESPHVALAPTGGVEALVDGLSQILTRPASTGSYQGLAEADLVVVLRADPSRTHPLVKTEIVQGVQQRGQRLILAHALSGGLERHAESCLRLEPGSEADLLAGLTRALLDQRPVLEHRIEELPGAQDWISSLAGYSEELVCSQTSVSVADFRRLVGLMLQARRPQLVVVTGLGIPGNEAAAARAAVQLSALLPGNGGVLVLSEKANVQGLVDVGVHPHLLPGHRPASESRAGEEVAALTASRVAAGVGWTAREACDAAALGEVGALLLAGVDPVRTFPREYQGPAAVKGAGFVICLDAFLTDSARMADVVLPVALLAEREGSTIGLDGVRRRLRRALAPPVPLPGDGDLLRQLGARLGLEIPVGERLQDEMNRVVGWPHPPAVLRRLLPAPQPEARLGWSGILLDGSPHLFHSGSVTTRSAILRELAPPMALRLHPDDALELDVGAGDVVSVASGGRELLLRARVDPTVRRSTAVVLWGAGRHGASELIESESEPVAVRLRRSQ